MLELYRSGNCALCDEIEERLKAWVLAHRVITLSEEEGDAGAELPRLKEGDQLYSGHEAIAAFLDELEAELVLNRSISADACYLDPEDPTTCL